MVEPQQRRVKPSTMHTYDEAARGLFGNTPYTARYDERVSSVRRTTGNHPKRGIYASELFGAGQIEASRLNRLAFAKRRTAYQQAKAFAEAMSEKHTDATLIRDIWWTNTVRIDDALAHIRSLIAKAEVTLTQAIRLVVKMYQQVPEHAEHMIRRNS